MTVSSGQEPERQYISDQYPYTESNLAPYPATYRSLHHLYLPRFTSTDMDRYRQQRLYVSDRNGSIIAFYSKEQLGSNAIKGIIEDEMSNVWVGTGNDFVVSIPKQEALTDIPRPTDCPSTSSTTPPPVRSLTENCISELSTV